MHNRAYGFVALLAVISVSIVFGMILGGRLNAPQVVFAAPAGAQIELAPVSTSGPAVMDFADIVERATPAVVGVTSTQLEGGKDADLQDHPFLNDPFFRRFFGDPEQQEPNERPQPHPRIGEGSGFIISPDGYILTNNHVVEDSDSVVVNLADGGRFTATVVGTDPSIDLALIKIDPAGKRLPTLPLGDSEGLRVGEWVIAIGNPLEFAQTVTVGVVSGKERRVPLRSTEIALVSFIQTDAAINFGNSGGPLIDGRGNVVGINTAINRQFLAEGIGFALPINQARNVVDQLRERGYVRRGFLGITMNREPVDEAAREFYALQDTNGVIVSDVKDDGPAARAGLQRGDVIRKVDGQVVTNNFDLVSKIASHQPGDKVHLQVHRKPRDAQAPRTLDLTVALADRGEGMAALNGTEQPTRPDAQPEPEVEEAKGLGLTVETVTPRVRERLRLGRDQVGVVVSKVEFASPASDKGLQPDMVVTAINDTPIESVADWRELLERLSPGSSVKLDVLADDQVAYIFLRLPVE